MASEPQPVSSAAHAPARSAPARDAPRPPQRGKALVLRDAVHWEAITSPTRFEILEQMRSAAPCSVAELAKQMDRPADGLYHHLRILLDARLIREIGQRPVGKQVEAIYDLAYDELMFQIDPATGRNVEEMRKLIGTLLRLCGRVFDAAVGSPDLVGTGPGQNAWGRLDTTWLTDDALAEVNRHLAAITLLTVEGNQRREGHLITLGFFGGPALRPRRADGSRTDRPAAAEAAASGKGGRSEVQQFHRVGRLPRERQDIDKRRV